MEKRSRYSIDSPESMIRTIREFGMIPFVNCGIPGWSVEEQTDPAYWFTSSEELGPWDWKIDAIREGDIAYAKFLSNKAAFATVEFYGHLMNWRRSIPRYRMALGESYPARNHADKLCRHISPVALGAVKAEGALEAKDIRSVCSRSLTTEQLRDIGEKYRDVLTPAIKKNVMDTVHQFLEMGTWTVIGDFTRVYRGPNLEYTGWQRSSVTTPDSLFGTQQDSSDVPFWAKHLEDGTKDGITVDCTPEESRRFLIGRILERFPGYGAVLEKLI